MHGLFLACVVLFGLFLPDNDAPLAGGGSGGGRPGHEGGGGVHIEIVKTPEASSVSPTPPVSIKPNQPTYSLPQTPPQTAQKPSQKKHGPTVEPLPGPAGAGVGNGQGAGVGPGSGPGTGAEGNNATLAQILSRIERSKRYPAVARRMGQEGRARVAFRIGPSGEALDPTLKVSSQHTALDEEALATIRRAAPFPVYEKPLEVWIVFEIKD